MSELKAFVCHSSKDSEYVLQVCAYLKRSMVVFTYEEHQRANATFKQIIDENLDESNVFLIFLGKTSPSEYVIHEVKKAIDKKAKYQNVQILPIILDDIALTDPIYKAFLKDYSYVNCKNEIATCAHDIVTRLVDNNGVSLPWNGADGLPYDPHLFSYEKDIIRFFGDKAKFGAKLYEAGDDEKEEDRRVELRRKIVEGCPAEWPTVANIKNISPSNIISHRRAKNVETELGCFRSEEAMVGAAALIEYNIHKLKLYFPEAGPRKELLFPVCEGHLHIGILVAGGIAPGINAVIDSIVQRHYKYRNMDTGNYKLKIYGYQNGFNGILDNNYYVLCPSENYFPYAPPGNRLATSEYANQGGSMIGTSRMDALISSDTRLNQLEKICGLLAKIDILYMIGGDGTMKAAHALWSVAKERLDNDHREFPLSVVAVPKTMDNDILWVWQSFGFLSAVEKAREFVENLYTEITANPRLCVLQLFGSDSGYVVSHAVLASAAGHCDLALIPEAQFSLLGIANHLKNVINRKNQPIPNGLVVMGETAIPLDAACYIDPASIKQEDITRYQIDVSNYKMPSLDEESLKHIQAIREKLDLSIEEKTKILEFDTMRRRNERIQGQTSDVLRHAGLKMVMQGLEAVLANPEDHRFKQLRMLANEPRHLVRAIPPSTADIVMALRLGTLAVDNAMAGYTDFMISQWLTEYVLVPLKLAVLGRKEIPESGIFWKSLLAKTNQTADLVSPWPNPKVEKIQP